MKVLYSGNGVEIMSRRADINPLQNIDMRVLYRDEDLATTISRILSMDESQVRRAIGNTTSTAYRRVHDVIATTLDRIVEASRNRRSEELSRLMVELSRCLIVVRYQLARKQISPDIANNLMNVINTVINNIKSGSQNIEQVALRARTLLDAIAVLVYQFGKK